MNNTEEKSVEGLDLNQIADSAQEEKNISSSNSELANELALPADNSDNDTPTEQNGDVILQTEGNDIANNSDDTPINQSDEDLEKNNHESVEHTTVPLTNEAVTGLTANLWRYLPIPTEEPDAMPEYRNASIIYPGSNVIAARVRGKKHKHEGTNCDDWYETANVEDITIVAVSDGAGSKKFSRVGARDSCRAAIGFLINTIQEEQNKDEHFRQNIALPMTDDKCMEACRYLASVVQQSVVKAYEAVETAFYSRSIDKAYEGVLNRKLQLKDFSGTLLIVVIVPTNNESKENLFVSCQIGDGMIAIINSKGSYEESSKLMGEADSGDFSGETDFLTSPKMKSLESLQNRTKVSRSAADTVFVMTDGVSDDYFPNETEMTRLYFDLTVNGIIDFKKMIVVPDLSLEQISLLKKIPDPLTYPWVNDQKTKITLQYTNRICNTTQLTLEDIWTDPTVLYLAQLEIKKTDTDKSEKLKIWLDNYVERGSFDDRTLVIVQL